MSKPKFLKTAGLTVLAITLLSVLDFLGARFMAPFSPFYKDRVTVSPTIEPKLPPLDLTKIKISDTAKVLAQRGVLEGQNQPTGPVKIALRPEFLEALGAAERGPENLEKQQTTTLGAKGAGLGGNAASHGDFARDLEALEQAIKTGESDKFTSKEDIVVEVARLRQHARAAINLKALTSLQNIEAEMLKRSNQELSQLVSKSGLLKMASYGDANALYALSDNYKYGFKDGFTHDPVQMIYWLKEAARAGHVYAQSLLGARYLRGDGVKASADKARYWLQKAADAGEPNAMRIVAKNPIFKESQVQKKVPAANKPAIDYPIIDYPGAQQTIKSAYAGDAKAQHKLGLYYYTGAGTQRDEKKAFSWYLKAANQGHPMAQTDVGLNYHYGRAVNKDAAEAAKWFGRAALSGHIQGQNLYADALLAGNGLKKDVPKAVKWYEKAGVHGDGAEIFHAAFNLTKIYYDGESQMQKDYTKAFMWAQKLQTVDSLGTSNFYLGRAYENGHGIKQDTTKAIQYYQKGADGKGGNAQYALALMYLEGRGTTPDRAKATEWLRKSASNANFQAMTKLNELGEEF